MIHFTCAQCGTKFKVQPQFAGRSSRCPTCKQALTVPTPEPTQLPSGQIDGSASSLHQAGLDPGVTLAQGKGGPGQKSIAELLARHNKKGERYVLEGEIARGGMGAVLRAIDCDIRREVAVKYLLDQTDPNKKLRFIEEAQITGQLEHPNIVPIHELGVDAQKRLFFSMKMVKGRSLAQVLDELRSSPNTAEKEWSLGRLLSIFVSVCHALAYAHACDTVHRDLKPANIMVGDFGEVYVMDWGLAKVLGRGARDEGRGAREDQAPVTSSLAPRPSSLAPLAVQTSREPDADLTQDGAILGTPVYMPPEQAAGRIQAIDQRSDVYSLGAILYELMTLHPPIDRDGGYLAVLMRVMEGAIVPPEQRARAGKVPRELSAIALKAMAKEPADRYPSVEALRRDIERFQEGRSVSAKEDSKREMLWKFVKRNKGFSVGMAATFLVLLCSLWFIGQAYLRAEQALADFQTAEQEKREQGRKSVPAFVRAAELSVKEERFDDALAQVTVALEHEPAHGPARLLRGQLRIVRKEFGPARADLERYLQDHTADADVRQLVELCRKARPEDTTALRAFVEILQRQRAFVLAGSLTTSRDELVNVYRRRIEAAWPGRGRHLRMESDGRLILDLTDCREVTNLEPLRGMSLSGLVLYRINVTNLAPLEGMRLASLSICGPISDLGPLHEMPLTYLNLYGCENLKDLTPLHGLPLKSLSLSHCHGVADITPLKGLPLTQLDIFGCDGVADLRPLQKMPLSVLSLSGTKLTDVSPLRGMPLTELRIRTCPGVRDWSPLKGLRLTMLDIVFCPQFRDVSVLADMPLKTLVVYDTGVADLTPLASLPLEELSLTPHRVTKSSLNALRDKKGLKTLGFWDGKEEKKMPAEEFWKRYDNGEFDR